MPLQHAGLLEKTRFGPLRADEAPAFSAVAFQPPGGGPVARPAVWLLSALGFRLGDGDWPAWDLTTEELSPAGFLYREEGFWLLNRALPPGSLSLDGQSVAKGALVPLIHGQTLQLRSASFHLEID